jgi:hypothetical protein
MAYEQGVYRKQMLIQHENSSEAHAARKIAEAALIARLRPLCALL